LTAEKFNKNSKGMSKKKMLGLGVLGLGAMAVIGSATGEDNRSSSGGPANTPAPARTAAAAPNKVATIGDTITLGDQKITLIESKATRGDGLIKPESGNIWLNFLVEIEATKDDASYNPFYFKVKDSDNYEYNFTPFGETPQLQSSNDLSKGSKAKGWITFEVPSTEDTFTFVYSPMFSSDRAEFTIRR
jgi:hypothetical protein